MAKQKWDKIGLIFCPSGEKPWMYSHAAVPIAEHLDGDIFKIYFTSRDEFNRSHTGYVIVDLARPNRILELSTHPVLSPGGLGEFDDSGAMACCLAYYEGRKYLYYIGWNLGVTVPFRNSIGLAVAEKGKDFTRYANGPILDRNLREPHFCASCCVLPGTDFWRMWYLSCVEWVPGTGGPKHKYHIKYAESNDGIHWQRDQIIAIDFKDTNEYAISRPSVLREKDKWKMWYSFRGLFYRIGYAESENGRQWRRLDHHAGIDVSKGGWDSEMIEYPFVFDHKGQRFMLYNGNGYGKTGFGLAVQSHA